MEALINFITPLIANFDSISNIIGLLIALFIAIAKLSATKTDDEIAGKIDNYWNKIKKFFDKYIPIIATRKSVALKKEEATALLNNNNE